ncbi:MAG: haloacid dehalogenase-like hydrolase [Lachnospiraceae bacterium]|nr:haloacid dehalogenase-like hydrolase [Lachnospiraceae bacterium]
MEKKEYIRKTKEDRPVVAICYDFDKTLTPDDMQAQGYIQSVGYDVKEFWTESNQLAVDNEMDQNLAYMFKMVKEAEGNLVFNKDNLREYGAKVKLFPGVEEWFERMRLYGEEKGVIVEHYIISSGLKEMIEGTDIAQKGAFTKIFASSFYYNSRGLAEWPAQVINYTNKTQCLFRIEKGVLDINDPGVNEYFPPEKLRVPFRNMIYIGDSDTDVPCMKLVNVHGGYSIGVYNPEEGDKTKVYKMVRDNRIKMFAPADYTVGSQLDTLVKQIIDRTACNEVLEDLSADYRNEVREFDAANSMDSYQNEKDELIIRLAMSPSFVYTHQTIAKLEKFSDWSDSQKEKLLTILLRNNQVRMIAGDEDIRNFYNKLMETMDPNDENVDAVKGLFDWFALL